MRPRFRALSIKHWRLKRFSQSSVHETRLVAGSDLFINDQSELSESELLDASTTPLLVMALYPWDHFVTGDGSDDDDCEVSRLRSLLCNVAKVQSLNQSLQSEVVVFGAQCDAPPAFQTALTRSLEIAQRVVFHQHRAVYARLDHAALSELLPNLSPVVVSGDAGALQVLYRLPSSGFVLRRTVQVFLDKVAKRVLVAVDSSAHQGHEWQVQQQLFDVLREICRRCLGDSIATNVANVLYLATLQQDVDAWLESTQHVPPLDALAGHMWVESGVLESSVLKRLREAPATEVLEDGEVEEEHGAPAHKRFKSEASHNHHQQQQQHQHWQTQRAPAGVLTLRDDPSHYSAAGQDSHSVYGAGGPAPLPPPLPSPDQRLARSSSSVVGPKDISGNSLSLEERMAVGRWGEEYVYQQLCRSLGEQEGVQVKWVNETEESGLPYDITVRSGASQDIEYIEVKSTRTMEKGVFEISMNELDTAGMHGSRYSIYRVFNAGNAAQCRVVRLRNPIALVRQKKISLVLLMQ
ncbi:hypothetical protein PINS_up010172 [Pythium insidiosum]|nr:hypothetical protein PINS_up010172 [Pythium insidiosum]